MRKHDWELVVSNEAGTGRLVGLIWAVQPVSVLPADFFHFQSFRRGRLWLTAQFNPPLVRMTDVFNMEGHQGYRRLTEGFATGKWSGFQ